MKWWVRGLFLRWKNHLEDVFHPERIALRQQAWDSYCKRLAKCACCGTHFWHVDKTGQLTALTPIFTCPICGYDSCMDCVNGSHPYVHHFRCPSSPKAGFTDIT